MTVDDGFAAEPAVMVWADGERDRWLARAAALDHGRQEPGWAELTAEDVASLSPAQVSWLVTRGPADAARAAVTYTSFRGQRQRVDLDKVAIARFGPDVLDFAVDEADRAPDHFGMLLMPYRAARVAPLVAGWLRHLGSARLWARLWLRRHPDLAIRVLLPATTGKPGKVRQQAEDALRHLGTIHDGTLPAVPPLFALSPQAARTVRKGKAPAWTRPEALPQIRPADGGTLPEDDTAALIAALTWSRLEDPPEPAPGDPEPAGAEQPLVVEASAAAQPMVRGPEPEAEKVIARCDPASLAAFGRALLDAWLAADMPAAEAWVLLAQAHIGDDVTMDRLAPLVRGWPPKSRYLRAIDGHAVLATVGSDVSLRHLLAIEENMSDMSGHRFRPARDLPDVLLPHRILGPLARRLLWGEYDPAGRLVRGLRIAEDGSFADLHDSAAAVGGDVPIGVVHPAELGADLCAWRQIFADYEILQPFLQLHRPVVALTAEERAATGLAGFGPVASERILELVRDDWRGNGDYSAKTPHTRISRELSGGMTLLVDFEPGVPTASYQNTAGEQRIVEIWADHAWSDHWQLARRTPMGACDPGALSEALAELYAGVIV